MASALTRSRLSFDFKNTLSHLGHILQADYRTHVGRRAVFFKHFSASKPLEAYFGLACVSFVRRASTPPSPVLPRTHNYMLFRSYPKLLLYDVKTVFFFNGLWTYNDCSGIGGTTNVGSQAIHMTPSRPHFTRKLALESGTREPILPST